MNGKHRTIFGTGCGRAPSGQRGVIALMTVIMLGAMLLVVGISAAFIGQTDVIIVGQIDRGYYVRSLAGTCVEEAMHRLKLDPAYVGGTIPIGSGNCTVTVSGSGTTRTVVGAATYDGFTKSIGVSASRRGNIAGNAHAWNIDSWQEVDQ